MMKCILLVTTSFVSPMAVRPKLDSFREGGSNAPPPREPLPPPPGPRDVEVRLYDIATPDLAKALSLVTGKEVHWFPKLTLGVAGRVWSYDGAVERTVNSIVENAAGGAPLRSWNLGPTELTDGEIDALLARMAASDYSGEEYDFFFRNCNHFVSDASARFVGDAPGAGVDPRFVEDVVLAESESLLSNMPGFQQTATRAVTRQVQKVIVQAWRKQWKRALAEHDEAEPATQCSK